MSVLERCLSCRESNKGSKEREGPTVGVCLIEVLVKSESTVAWVLRLTQSVSSVIQILGSLSNDDGDVKENGKKAIGLDLCTCITLICTFLCRRCPTTT